MLMMLIFVGIIAWAVTYSSLGWNLPSCQHNYFNNPFLKHEQCDKCVDMKRVLKNAKARKLREDLRDGKGPACYICHSQVV